MTVTVSERLDQIRDDLKTVAKSLVDSDDPELAIMFLATVQTLSSARRQADWLGDQQWEELATPQEQTP